ncbi:glucose-6-phosphate isomerase [Candidatus Saccharibacteria bacterium]|nr:glucose-6-phosphate isomerase [Candidatus Saccharibacteria bacterium]
MIKVNFESKVDTERAYQIINEIENDAMGGWYALPRQVDEAELAAIKRAAAKIREDSEVLVCIGIGGSYLGHRAVIEALGLDEARDGANGKSNPEIIYAGNSLSERELERALARVGERDFSVNVISKSGTTLEPARAFLKFREKLVEKYGEKKAAERIYATTDAAKGTLHDEAVEKGYTRFVVPDNIGGRYSVLTAVGLLPMAVAGVDVDALLAGAAEGAERIAAEMLGATDVVKAEDGGDLSLAENPAVKYAFMRQNLGARGYDTEVFATFEPCMGYFNEWLKQLFGESEGKNRQGVWPASVVYSTDLHSLGQFMQEGRRNLWETIIDVPTDETNAKVVAAVKTAHAAGGIPVLTVTAPSLDERGLGELIYFFELSCAISAKLFGVNPFDQPGVEAYKKELKRLLAE